MGTSGLQGVCSSPPNVLGVSGGNCITAPIAPKTCKRSSLTTDLGGVVPWGPTAPMTLQEYTEARANAEHTGRIVYCTAPYHTMLYDTMPHHAILYIPRYAVQYHAIPQCHTILHNVPPEPWCPGWILRASSRAYGDSGSGSGSGVWHARLAGCLPQHAANRAFRRTSRAR